METLPAPAGRAAPAAPVEIERTAPYFRAGDQRWFPTGWCAIRPELLRPEHLRAMAAAGCDTVRLWSDHNESGVLAPNLVELVREAEALGIRCSVTVLNLGELSDTFIDKPNLKRVRNAYRSICETPAELLTLPAALDLSRRRIDACLDAVGDSPAVFEWVVCSQIDSIYQVPLRVYEEFTADMSAHLAAGEERRFGWRRPRTLTSYDPLPVGDAFYTSEHLEVVGLHCYSPAVYAPVDGLQAAWEIAHTTAAAARRRGPGRPVHCIEYGPIQHQFVPDSPPLPAELLRRYRRSTAFAHLCAGGAGVPLIIPATPIGSDGPADSERARVTDQVRPIPPAIDPALVAEEAVVRTVLADPAFQRVDGRPATVVAPSGTLAAGCGSPGGAMVFWVAADTRGAQRRELLDRALAGDPDVPLLLGFDAAQALLTDRLAPLWNPISRMLAGKLIAKGLTDVADERVRAELGKLAGLLDELDAPAMPISLGGRVLPIPGSGRARSARCYDAATGERIASGTLNGELVLPDVAEVVVAID